jgi:hypothetical protein
MENRMGEGYNFEKFSKAILARSVSSDWDEAKTEWDLYLVYDDPSERSCECGHTPINQICVIENRQNRNQTEVGNVCVHKFLKLFSKRTFSAIRRVKLNNEKSLNPAALDMLLRRSVITKNEYDEYLSYWRKRTNISSQQRKQKLDINVRALDWIEAETQRMLAHARALGLNVKT